MSARRGTSGLSRLALRLESQFRGPLLWAMKDLQRRVNLSALIEAVASGNELAVLDAARVTNIDDVVVVLQDPLRVGLVQGGRLSAKQVGKGVVFDFGRPKIADWLRNHAGGMVTAISEGSRAALRDVLKDGVLRGRHPARLAEDVREVIGLNARQAGAVVRRRAALEAKGVPVDRVAEITSRYSEQLLKQRARMIAHTESMTAVNHGRAELWDQLIEEGAFEPDQMQQWTTGEDDAVCPWCEEMASAPPVRVGQPFVTPDGGLIDHPPGHQNCRCEVELL